jgi:hypothetical protein
LIVELPSTYRFSFLQLFQQPPDKSCIRLTYMITNNFTPGSVMGKKINLPNLTKFDRSNA